MVVFTNIHIHIYPLKDAMDFTEWNNKHRGYEIPARGMKEKKKKIRPLNYFDEWQQ